MTLRLRLLAILFVFLLSIPVAALEDEWEPVIVPLTFNRPVHDTFGSEWFGEIWAGNGGDATVEIGYPSHCDIPTCAPRLPINPGGARLILPSNPLTHGNPSIVFYLPKVEAHNIYLFGNLMELTTSLSTLLPFVREHELRRGRIIFPHVATSLFGRLLLRVYALHDESDHEILVEVEDQNARVSRETTLPLMPGTKNLFEPRFPMIGAAYAQMPIDSFNGPLVVRLTSNRDYPFWAITLTDNRTQEVDILTPE